ncbi:hypothetical protein FOZ60_001279 [Perkinsus olseni]|uniref:Ion transport domain-containing protein n=1 Tax=Perkinsus olseni TaxID=32597 RepID=A0A7J6P301_PEROL|nr:hypothetical protein FOZ60_001279 [Perkinsus olseni]
MSAAVHKRRPSLLQSSSFLIPPIRRQNSKGANFSSPEITDREDLIKTLRAISSDIAKAVLLDVQESIDQLSRSLNDKIDTVLAELGSERATTASPASSSDRRVSAAADRKHSRILFDRPGSTNDLSGSDHDVASPTNQARIVFGRRNRNIPITEKTASIPNLPGAPQTETSPLPSRRVARGASREHPPRASGSHRTSSSSSRSSSPSERARRQESRRARASITNFNAEEPRRRGSLDRTQSGGNRGRRNSHDAIEQNEEEGTTRVEAQSAEVGETNVGSESPVAELTHGHLKELLERYQRDRGVIEHFEGRYTAAEIEEKSVARARASTAGANKTSERTSVTKRTGRRAAVNLLALSSKLNLQGLITEEGSERSRVGDGVLTMIATSTATAVRDFFKEPVSPSSSGRIVWDMILAAALVYVIIGIPFEAAFVASEGSYPSSQLVLDAILLIDVLLQFHTQFSENGALISSRKRIARRYLKSWLWPELLTSIPWGLFISKYSRELSAIKLGRTLSLARLGNMTMTIMAKVEYRVQSEIWWIILGVLKLVSALLVMCHWGACLWWLVGKLSIEDHDISWITAMDMVDATRAQQYVAAMYFMTTTLTTVGYGDVTPETHVERLFCIFAEIVAGNFRYMNKHKLESSLRIRVRHFLHQLFENQTNLESRRALVEFLRTSESLQRDVYVGLMGKMLKRYSWFKGLSHEILGKVCSVCEDLYYAPTDVMIYASEDADGMYFVGTEVSSEAGDGRFIRRPVTFRKLASSAHLTSISNLLGAASRMYGDFFTGGSGPGEASFGPIPLGSNPLKEIEGGKGKAKMGAGSYCGQMSLFAPYVWPRTAVCSCFCEVLKTCSTMRRSDADCVDEDGLRPLFHAIRKHARIVTALLVAGADADSPFHLAQDDPLSDGLAAVDGQQSAPQHTKRGQVIEPWNFRKSITEQVEVMHCVHCVWRCSLVLSPVVRAVCDHTDFSALPEREVSRIMAYAAMAGYTAVVESALENLAPDGPGSAEARETIVNKLDDTAGYSLVHYASESGQEKLLYSLLLKRADPGKAAADGSMPIHLCARKGYDVCLTQLLEHGADPIATNTLGQTALDIALANNKFDIVNLLKALNIHELAKNGELEAIQNAASQGCNLDRTHPKTGFAPLYYAAERGNIEIMKLLLENGADPNRSEGQNEAVKLLLEWQADPNQVVGNVDPAKRSFGTSPLAAAIKKGSSELVDLLLDTGDVALTAEEFKTAFEKKSKPFIKRLMKALSPDFPARYQAIWELRSSNGESLIQHFARKGDVKILEMAKENQTLSIAALAGKDKAVTWLIEKAKVPVRWESLAKILMQLCRLKIKVVPVVQILIPIYERLAPDFDERNASDDEELVTITDLFAEAVKAPNYQLVKYLLDDHKRGMILKRLLESYGPSIMFRSDSVTSLSNSLGAIEGVALEGGLVVEAVKTKDAKVVKLLVEFLNGGLIKLNEEDQDTWNLTQAIGLAQEQGATETSEWLASHLPRPKEDKSGTSFFTNESNKKSTKRSSLISQLKSTGKESSTSSARGSALFSNNHSSMAQWSERLLMKLGVALSCLLWGIQAEAGGRTLDADFPRFVEYLRDRCGMEKVADPEIDTAILDRLSTEADTTGRDDRPWLLWYTTDGKITHPDSQTLGAPSTALMAATSLTTRLSLGGFIDPASGICFMGYAMGYLEGLATAEYLWLFYHLNTERIVGPPGERTPGGTWMKDSYFAPILTNFMEGNHNHQECRLEPDYLQLAHGYYCQLLGLLDGYNRAVGTNSRAKYTPSTSKSILAFLDILAINADGQLPELQQIGLDHQSLGEIRPHKHDEREVLNSLEKASVPQRCSALVKLVRNSAGSVTDVISAQ